MCVCVYAVYSLCMLVCGVCVCGVCRGREESGTEDRTKRCA